MTKNFLLLLCVLCISSCQSKKDLKAKNVILVIGDGMGPQQLSLLYYFAKMNSLGLMKESDYAFKKIASQGKVSISHTHPFENLIPDSACSATQLATGSSSRVQTIGLDSEGNPLATILEKAKAKGLATGLVSDTRITHATPASFAAHVASRFDESEIASQLIQSQTDILFSGGAQFFVPRGAHDDYTDHFSIKSKRRDKRDLIKEAKDLGYNIVFDKDGLEEKEVKKGQKILGLFASRDMPDGIWYSQNKKRDDRRIPTLLEMTKKAVKQLAKNEKGFFLLVEAGQIDWRGHENDAAGMLHEMISMNETVNWLHEWTNKNEETFLVVTADHETGNFAFGYNILNIPDAKKLTGSKFKEKKYQQNFNYGEKSTLDKLYKQKKILKNIWKDFDKLELSQRTEQIFQKMVKDVTGHEISDTKSKEILSLKPNPFYTKWHKTLNKLMIPMTNDFPEFYYNPKTTRVCLVGRAIGPKQNITWGTGGHTATPVPVFSQGPKNALDQMKAYTTHTELGLSLQKILGVL